MTIVRAISRIAFYFRIRDQKYWRIAACAVVASVLSSPLYAAKTTVRMEIAYGTNQGTIDIELYDDDQAPDQAPKTVANFLRYASRGDYSTNGIIYRSVPGFVIQTGGYAYEDISIFGAPYRYFFHIPTDPPVQNEFSPSRSNLRGTIAMAKLPNDPDSATSDWFINLDDNSANLDIQNGGFTVFGQVLNPGMTIVDAIANLPVLNASIPPVLCEISCNLPISAFNALPVINYNPATGLEPSNLVMVTSIPNVTATITQLGTVTQTTSAYAGDVDVTLSNPNSKTTVDPTTAASWLQTFAAPPGKTVQFNDEISTFTMTWTTGPSARVVTLYHGANTSVDHYYAYGPTLDNAAPHWYDFTFDGTTGAEFVGGKILLHFADGQRGDNDLIANSVTHIGAPALVTDIPSLDTSNSAGCTIAALPSQSSGNGDWVVVSLFLAFVALVRRRARR